MNIVKIYFNVRNFCKTNFSERNARNEFSRLASLVFFRENKFLRTCKYIQPKRMFGELTNSLN